MTEVIQKKLPSDSKEDKKRSSIIGEGDSETITLLPPKNAQKSKNSPHELLLLYKKENVDFVSTSSQTVLNSTIICPPNGSGNLFLSLRSSPDPYTRFVSASFSAHLHLHSILESGTLITDLLSEPIRTLHSPPYYLTELPNRVNALQYIIQLTIVSLNTPSSQDGFYTNLVRQKIGGMLTKVPKCAEEIRKNYKELKRSLEEITPHFKRLQNVLHKKCGGSLKRAMENRMLEEIKNDGASEKSEKSGLFDYSISTRTNIFFRADGICIESHSSPLIKLVSMDIRYKLVFLTECIDELILIGSSISQNILKSITHLIGNSGRSLQNLERDKRTSSVKNLLTLLISLIGSFSSVSLTPKEKSMSFELIWRLESEFNSASDLFSNLSNWIDNWVEGGRRLYRDADNLFLKRVKVINPMEWVDKYAQFQMTIRSKHNLETSHLIKSTESAGSSFSIISKGSQKIILDNTDLKSIVMNSGSQTTFPVVFPFEDVKLEYNEAFRKLKQTKILSPSHISLSSEFIQNFHTSCTEMSSKISANRSALRNILSNLDISPKEPLDMPGVLAWIFLSTKMILMSQLAPENKLEISKAIYELFVIAEKFAVVTDEYIGSVNELNSYLDSFIHKLKKKDVSMRKNINQVIGYSFQQVLCGLEEEGRVKEPETNILRITSTPSDIKIFTLPSPSKKTKLIRFSLLDQHGQYSLISSQIFYLSLQLKLATDCLNVSITNLDKNLSHISTKIITGIHPLESLVLIHSLKEVLKEIGAHHSSLHPLSLIVNKIKETFELVKTVLSISDFLKNNETRVDVRSRKIDRLEEEIVKNFIGFKLWHYVPSCNSLMKKCYDECLEGRGRSIRETVDLALNKN